MSTIKKIFYLLNPRERSRAGVLMIMILVMAFLDMLGVASILPFIAVMTTPELVQTNALLNNAFIYSRHIGIYTSEQYLFALGVLVFMMLIISLAFKALTTYAQTRFALMREYSIGKRLIEGYLHQPYSWFLNRHSADLGKNILSELQAIVQSGMLPLMTLMAQSAIALALLILLLLIDPILALSAGMTLVLCYGGVFLIINSWLKRLGQERTQANQDRFTVVSEAFGAAKEVKVGGLEQSYILRFAKPAKIYARAQTIANVIIKLPRFALEAIAFGGMLLVILYLMIKSGSFSEILPIFSLYVYAGYRLLPALQQIYSSISELRFIGPALDTVLKDLNELGEHVVFHNDNSSTQLVEAITLNRVSYHYPNVSSLVLKDINIIIPAKKMVGFVGSTGSGKTTMVDLILGLLEPQKGTISVDGQLITATNRRQWQRTIGYVPQHIYLTDDSIEANITFGVETKHIDKQAVKRAAEIANLHKFVINDLPQGYATIIGERGVRLSGGQRQRIGIARALYNNPQVLILDEATSALDNLTEQAVMESVSNLNQKITIILIAHRLSTVRKCDQIHLIEQGELKDSGTYEQLIVSNPQFAALAGTK